MFKNKLGVLFLLSGYLIFHSCSDDVEKEMKVSTGGIKNILANSADVSGQIIDMGTGVNQHGHYYGTSENVSSSGIKTQLGIPSGLKEFTSQLTGLDAGTKYYVKAYLSDGKTEVYGKEISFSTLSASLPILITSSIASITANSASCGGNISSDGGAPVTARGVCWSSSEDPDTLDSKTTNGSGTGSFVSSLAGLSASTTYYVRAYATNSAGTAYGNQQTFTTSAVAPVTPTVSTSTITGITQSTATGGGNISSDGGASVTARGICYSTSANPDISDSKTTNGSGTGSFVSNLTGLSASTTYYVRAYATNSAGTAYGNQQTFTTSAVVPVTPTLSTSAITGITQSTATGGGNISSDGGASVTVRGVCWNASGNPTIANSITSDGSGTGSFASSLTGLSASTTYYVRAYATNSAGTAYGNQQTFTTSAVVPVTPTVSTSTITGITQSTATGGGNVSSDGGASVTVRGVCWNTSSNPTILNFKTTDGSGTGSFASSLTGLTANTTYYVRAYATNSAGTAYGNELVFSTYTISDIDGNGYSTVTIGSQVWMRENLRTTKYNDGTSITLVSDKDTWASLITEAYCWYSNNEASYKETYGALYNWYAVNTGKLCPSGWHVPTLNDWVTLQTFVGGDAYGGAKLKEAGTSHWKTPNVGATNETGFTGLPGGDRDHYGNFYDLQYQGHFWSSTEVSAYTAHYASLKNDDSSIYILHSYPDERHGNSVRCLQDQ